MISMLILLACVLISRFISDKAIKDLSPEKKVELIDLFSGNRKKSLILVFVLVAVFFGFIKLNFIALSYLTITYAFLFFIILIVRMYSTYKKLIQNEFPSDFIKRFLIANSISVLGIVIFFGFLILR